MCLRLLLAPLGMLMLTGCIDVHEHPAPRHETVVTPPASPPPAVYSTPGSGGTVVTRP